MKTTKPLSPYSACLLATCLGLMTSNAAIGQTIVVDDFDSGTPQPFWQSPESVTLTTDLPKDGAYSSRWFFEGGGDTQDAWAEWRFDLGAEYTELTITFDLYIPPNYFHRDSSSSDNNKFLRLWTVTYDDDEKIGFSTINQGSTGESQIGVDYRRGPGGSFATNRTSAQDWITMDDRGKWIAVEIYVRAATSTEPAVVKLYKNGALHYEDTNIENDYTAGSQGYRYGYLLGWSNSGYAEDTIFYMDNVQFIEGSLNKPGPPMSLVVN